MKKKIALFGLKKMVTVPEQCRFVFLVPYHSCTAQHTTKKYHLKNIRSLPKTPSKHSIITKQDHPSNYPPPSKH